MVTVWLSPWASSSFVSTFPATGRSTKVLLMSLIASVVFKGQSPSTLTALAITQDWPFTDWPFWLLRESTVIVTCVAAPGTALRVSLGIAKQQVPPGNPGSGPKMKISSETPPASALNNRYLPSSVNSEIGASTIKSLGSVNEGTFIVIIWISLNPLLLVNTPELDEAFTTFLKA